MDGRFRHAAAAARRAEGASSRSGVVGGGSSSAAAGATGAWAPVCCAAGLGGTAMRWVPGCPRRLGRRLLGRRLLGRRLLGRRLLGSGLLGGLLLLRRGRLLHEVLRHDERQHGAHRVRVLAPHHHRAPQHAAQLGLEGVGLGLRAGGDPVEHPPRAVDPDEHRLRLARRGVQLPAPLAGVRPHARAAVAQRLVDLPGQVGPELRGLRRGERAHRQPATGECDVDGLHAPVGRGLHGDGAGQRHGNLDRAEVDHAGGVGDLGVEGLAVVRAGDGQRAGERIQRERAARPRIVRGGAAPSLRWRRPLDCVGTLRSSLPGSGRRCRVARVRRLSRARRPRARTRAARRPRRTARARPSAPRAARSGRRGAAAAPRAGRG